MQGAAKPAVFLDRDGTVIEDVGYPRDPARVRLLGGAAPVLARFTARGFLLVVVSNQSGVGRGLVTPAEADAVHRRFVACLADAGVRLDAAYYCPHAPEEGCACRKPSPAMLLRAAAEWAIDLAASFVVGDKLSDVEAGRRAGCRTIWLAARDVTPGVADAVAADWAEVERSVLAAAGAAQAYRRPSRG